MKILNILIILIIWFIANNGFAQKKVESDTVNYSSIYRSIINPNAMDSFQLKIINTVLTNDLISNRIKDIDTLLYTSKYNDQIVSKIGQSGQYLFKYPHTTLIKLPPSNLAYFNDYDYYKITINWGSIYSEILAKTNPAEEQWVIDFPFELEDYYPPYITTYTVQIDKKDKNKIYFIGGNYFKHNIITPSIYQKFSRKQKKYYISLYESHNVVEKTKYRFGIKYNKRKCDEFIRFSGSKFFIGYDNRITKKDVYTISHIFYDNPSEIDTEIRIVKTKKK